MDGTTILGGISSALTEVIGMAGDVVSALFTSNGDLNALAPFFFVGVACSVVFLGVKVIKSLVWGA